MDIFLARQPIFDRDLQVQAYELLYRSDGSASQSIFNDGSRATSQVIAQSILVTDFEKLVAHKRAFIHFTQDLILEEIPHLFDRDRMVIELDAISMIDEAFANALEALKRKGYSIAVDLGTLVDEALLDFADIIKVDFTKTDHAMRQDYAQRYKKANRVMLAEKVETRGDFQEALSMGYSLFQGYFFAKPDTVKSKDIHPLSTTYVRLLAALNEPDPSYETLASIIEMDVAISFKLLKLINSAAFYRRSRIQSIQQALVLLGLKELRKWVVLLMLQDVGSDKPDELLKTVLIRGRMMELIAKQNGLNPIAPECFLTGMLSLIDVMTDQPLPTVVQQLSLSDAMTLALLSKEDTLGFLLALVIAYEQSETDTMKDYCQWLRVDALDLPLLYFESMEWVDMMISDKTPEN